MKRKLWNVRPGGLVFATRKELDEWLVEKFGRFLSSQLAVEEVKDPMKAAQLMAELLGADSTKLGDDHGFGITGFLQDTARLTTK